VELCANVSAAQLPSFEAALSEELQANVTLQYFSPLSGVPPFHLAVLYSNLGSEVLTGHYDNTHPGLDMLSYGAGVTDAIYRARDEGRVMLSPPILNAATAAVRPGQLLFNVIRPMYVPQATSPAAVRTVPDPASTLFVPPAFYAAGQLSPQPSPSEVAYCVNGTACWLNLSASATDGLLGFSSTTTPLLVPSYSINPALVTTSSTGCSNDATVPQIIKAASFPALFVGTLQAAVYVGEGRSELRCGRSPPCST
jgi:hypothetical protein